MKNRSKNITILSVILFNVLATMGLRWLVFAGKFGAGSVLIWVVAAVLFYIPATFIYAELGAAYPEKEGAITDWVKAQLGERCALLTTWFYCIALLLFISTALTFIGISIGYEINPQLAQNKTFISCFVIVAFWIMLFLTTRSLEVFKKSNEITCLLGVILPVVLLVVAAFISVFIFKNKVPTDFSASSWVPHFKLSNILFLMGVSSAMGGAEISAPFITRMKNPQKNFPLAILIAALLIVVCYIAGTLALLSVIAPKDFNTSNGFFEVLSLAFSEIHMGFMSNIVFALMSVAMLAASVLWLTSPAKMLIDGNDPVLFPKFMLKRTADGLPINTMLLQGGFLTLIVLLSDTFSTVDTIYNSFVMSAVVLLFLAYIFVFVAFIKMKFTNRAPLVFEMPGKKVGAIVAFILVICMCSVNIIIPIVSVPKGANVFIYEAGIIGIPVMFAVLGLMLYRRKRGKKAQENK